MIFSVVLRVGFRLLKIDRSIPAKQGEFYENNEKNIVLDLGFAHGSRIAARL